MVRIEGNAQPSHSVEIHRSTGASSLAFALTGLTLCLLACGGDSVPEPRQSIGEESLPKEIVFTQDIAPIFYENCSGCHRPGEAGPFDLLTYGDVSKRGRQIVEVISRRFMPPWLPEPGHVEFADERVLSARQIALITQWVEDGMPEGNPSNLPPLPQWPEGWQLGEPDLVVQMPEAYTLRPGGPDEFRNFAIPLPLQQSRYVKGFEFRPGNAKIVHHASMRFDRTGRSREHDQADPEPGFGSTMFLDEILDPDGHWLSWTPGKQPSFASEGLSWALEPGTDLVLEAHLLPSGKPETIRSTVGFFFTDEPPSRKPLMLRLGSKSIDIPPGEDQYTIEDSYVLPVDVQVLTVYPHAHYLAKKMEGFATLPDGTRQPLIYIPEWDFNWQDEYRYAEPVFLPKGTTLRMRFTYDNSADNVRNPHHPPKRVTYGWNSSQEMGDLWLQVLTRDPKDRPTLLANFEIKDHETRVAGYRKQLEVDPRDHEKRNALGNLYLQSGQFQRAESEFRKVLQHKPGYHYAHYNLGLALEAQGEKKEAIRRYRKALDLKPDHAPAHNNLGIALATQGRAQEAVQHFRLAVKHDPDFAEAHNNLGIALGASRETKEAIRHFQEALKRRENYAEAHNNLGGALLSQGRIEEAIREFRAALEIEPNYDDARRNLELAQRAKSAEMR